MSALVAPRWPLMVTLAIALTQTTGGCGAPEAGVRAPTAPQAAPLAPPVITAAARSSACQEAKGGCLRVVPTKESALSEGALAVAGDDWANNSTGQPGVTLAREIVFPPFLWVANHTNDTVSRVNTKTGREEGRYWVGRNPSRTAVDLEGNVWIGGRDDGRLTSVLWDVTKCPDRDGDGVIRTASAENLGPLNSAEAPLADECVAQSLVPTPSLSSIRGIAAGPDGRVWFGFTSGGVQSIDPETGELGPHYPSEQVPVYQRDGGGVYRPVVDEQRAPLTTAGGGVYGLVVDREGFLYVSPMQKQVLTRFNVFTKRWDAVYQETGCSNYGIAIDGRDRVWLGCSEDGVMMFDPASRRTQRFRIPAGTALEGGATVAVSQDQGDGSGVTGLAVEPATGQVWASFWNRGFTGRLRVDDNEPIKSRWTLIATSPGADLRGVGFDHEGFAWTHGVSSDLIWKIDPETSRLAPGFEQGRPIGGGPHYTYSDFTGSTGLSFTAPRGVWRFIVDAPQGASPLRELRWQASVPARTAAELRLRPVDAEGAAAGGWVPAPTEVGAAVYSPYESGSLQTTLDLSEASLDAGRYEVEVRLSATGAERPVVNAVELIWSDGV